MGKLDENYFKITNNEQANTIEDIIGEDEQILWRGKPKKKAFILGAVFKMMPIALIWLLFDGCFIVGMFMTGFEDMGFMSIFLILFFAIHLMPVWIWLGQIITSFRQYKNIEYAFTNKRIIIRSGIIGIDFKNIYYSEIESVNLKVGLLDKLFKVGDIYIKGHSQASVLNDLDNPYFLTQRLQEIVVDIKTDIQFPNNLRPESNDGYNTKYNKK